MKELRADIFGFVEINQTMERGIKQKWEQTTRKLFQHSRTINSESKIPAEHLQTRRNTHDDYGEMAGPHIRERKQ
jgi:hypothetical protein